MNKYHALVKNPADGEIFLAEGGPFPDVDAADAELTKIHESKGFEVFFVADEATFEALALNLLKGLGQVDRRVWHLDQLQIFPK
jgi:hypothetical protein